MAAQRLRMAASVVRFRHYPWSEFQETLIATIGEWENTPNPNADQGEYYFFLIFYDPWVAHPSREARRRTDC